MHIIINGAGVAGPALAYWLRRSGHSVLLVEREPQLRRGGYIVDFWGVGYDIVERMGLIGEIRRLGYQVEEVRFVDRRGRTQGGFDTSVFTRLTGDRFTSVRRSDVSATIYRAIEHDVETIFGDSITGLAEDATGVTVRFGRAAPRRADLVIGADGLHSRVRALAFGSESRFEVPLGYHVAAFETTGYRSRDDLVYMSHGLPGRQLSRFSMRDDKTLLLFVFRDEYMTPGPPKAVLKAAFGGMGWEWPQVEKALERADDLYFDRVSQIRLGVWTTGRIALVGDAAACVSLMAGEGTGLAILEAYVLASELRAAAGDYAAAFARYEQRLMPFLRKKQLGARRLASSFAPKSRLGVAFRNAVTNMMRVPFVAEYFIGRDLRDDLTLPDYEW